MNDRLTEFFRKSVPKNRCLVGECVYTRSEGALTTTFSNSDVNTNCEIIQTQVAEQI